MARARPLERSASPGDVRGAASAAPRPAGPGGEPATPLTIVEAAVAGDDLESVARSAADGLGRPVAIVLAPSGPPVVWPADGAPPATLEELRSYAAAVAAGRAEPLPGGVAHAAPVRLGGAVVGVVAALGPAAGGSEQRPWLDAAAAAAAVTALMRGGTAEDALGARRAFLRGLALGPPDDVAATVAQALRLGCDLSAGVVAIAAAATAPVAGGLAGGAFASEIGPGRIVGLLPLAGGEREARDVEIPLAGLRELAGPIAASARHPDPATLHQALREAGVLLELMLEPDAMLSAHEQTYRLLVWVLLTSPDELYRLRDSTVSVIERYDREHDTELIATLERFLAHHGSTTETAEAMGLHRHTVGYRLARVQEVSGLSPYESDGRERLGLGLKAQRILTADARRAERLS
jgi:PucR family transcriptional regulator, purine catabolism regulatory protein